MAIILLTWCYGKYNAKMQEIVRLAFIVHKTPVTFRQSSHSFCHQKVRMLEIFIEKLGVFNLQKKDNKMSENYNTCLAVLL